MNITHSNTNNCFLWKFSDQIFHTNHLHIYLRTFSFKAFILLLLFDHLNNLGSNEFTCLRNWEEYCSNYSACSLKCDTSGIPKLSSVNMESDSVKFHEVQITGFWMTGFMQHPDISYLFSITRWTREDIWIKPIQLACTSCDHGANVGLISISYATFFWHLHVFWNPKKWWVTQSYF